MLPSEEKKKPADTVKRSSSSSDKRRRGQSGQRRTSGPARSKSQGARSSSSQWKKNRPSSRRPDNSNPKSSTLPQQPTGAAASPVMEVKPDLPKPERNCDITMNGGLAGVFVYPSAAVELAKTYRFRRIGGSSLGSVSAALTAAAELGRNSKNGGFKELSNILTWMKEGSPKNLNIYQLLQPENETTKYFDSLKKLKGKSSLADAWSAGVSALGKYPLISLLSLIPAGLVAYAAILIGFKPLLPNAVVMGVMMALAVALAVIIPPVAAFSRLISGVRKALFKNNFGLCMGKSAPSGKKSLISWLSENLNKLAGKEESASPLVFKDLWGEKTEEQEKEIDLQMLATDISLGQPMKFPQDNVKVEQPEDVYYFREEDMSRYFPEEVVSWLVTNARKGKYFNKVKGFIPLPEPADLPVVFALRISMSIPFIMSSVPLYRVNRIRQKGRVRWQMSKSWITGAGLAGNFHVHSFDRPLPVWPTFAIHVAPVGGESDGYGDKKKGIWVQNLINQQGPSIWQGFGHYRSFLKAAYNVAGIWEDRILLQTPGFKERMAVVKIAQSQAGLFPKLDRETGDHLVNLGENAARQLAERYTRDRQTNSSTSWDAHRWIRYRNAMALFERKLVDFKTTYHGVYENEETFDHLIMRGPDEAPDAYRWSDTGQRNHALRVTNQLLDFIGRWQKDDRTFSSGDMPTPAPDMSITPMK